VQGRQGIEGTGRLSSRCPSAVEPGETKLSWRGPTSQYFEKG